MSPAILSTIPFENLDVVAKRPIRLDLPALHEKLVHHTRGGYCYEHNLLLLDVLQRLGFQVKGLAARVHGSRPPGILPPRSHMLLQVDLAEGPHIVDVGFGTALTAPLVLVAEREQPTPHGVFRLVQADGEFDLQVRKAEAWTDLYRFSLQAQMPIDYEALNWYTSTYPDSVFVRNLIAARPAPQNRLTLFNDKFTVRHADGRTERRILRGADEFGEVLAIRFGIAPTDPDDLEMAAAVAAERAAHPDFFER